MIERVQVALSIATIEKLIKVEKMMMEQGMAEQDSSFIISKLCDFYFGDDSK